MSPGKTVKVLFVEDAFDQALLVKAFLQADGGYEVTHTQDGDKAVQLIMDEEWSVVITDLNLPGTDGFAVIRAAREYRPNVKVLATTGYTGAQYQEEAFRAGADALMNKPLDKAEFLAKVAALTGDATAGGGAAEGGGGILAIGGLVGDVEMGCGGTLIQAAAEETDVLILPLCRDEQDAGGVGLGAAQEAAKILGARVVIDEVALDEPGRRIDLLTKTVSELCPAVAYLPAMDEAHPARMEAFRIGKAATSSVETVLGYQTATTGMEFRPGRFVDVADDMVLKMEALTAYNTAGTHRVDLTPRLAQAYARYWGRYQKFGEVEAFEALRESS